MADDRALEADPTPGAGPNNPLLVALRRWPLLAGGLLAGVVLGVLIHLTSTASYQSVARLLVVKQSFSTSAAGNAVIGAMEDYVATQVQILKSEKIRIDTAKALTTAGLASPLPDDERLAALVLQNGLVVAKDRESTPGQISSGVIDVSYRCVDPVDAKKILTVLIEVYKKELHVLFEKNTTDALAVADKEAKNIEQNKKSTEDGILKMTLQLRKQTPDLVEDVQRRLTSKRDENSRLDLDKSEFEDTLDIIRKTEGKDLRVRNELAIVLQAQGKGVGIGMETTRPEVGQLKMLELKEAELLREYGPDNTRVQDVRTQITFLRADAKARNPNDPTGEVDRLNILRQVIEGKLASANKNMNKLSAIIDTDEKVILDSSELSQRIKNAEGSSRFFEGELTRLNARRSTLQATQDSGGYSARELSYPTDAGRVAPVLTRSLAVGVALGLLLGAVAVALAELGDKSFRSPAEIRRRLGLPVIAHIPDLKTASRSGDKVDPALAAQMEDTLVVALRPSSILAEAYRGVRTQLYFSTQGRGHQVIQVTSPNPGDGKSTLAANLAAAIAQSGKSCVLIDCDFRKPRIHKLFHMDKPENGLAKVVNGEILLSSAVRRSPIPNLDLMPCGPRPANPAELLTSPKFVEVLDELKTRYEFVIIDTPPMLAVSDPAAVAPRVDGVLLVFRMSKKARPAAERAREQLAALGANVLGVVVNGSTGSSGSDGYGYGYGYGSYKYQDYEYAESYAEKDDDSKF